MQRLQHTHYPSFATTVALVNTGGGNKRITKGINHNYGSNSRRNNNDIINHYNDINIQNNGNDLRIGNHRHNSNNRNMDFYLWEEQVDFQDSSTEMFVPTSMTNEENRKLQFGIPNPGIRNQQDNEDEDESRYYSDYEIVDYEESEEEWADDFPIDDHGILEMGDHKALIPEVVVAECPTSFDIDSPSFLDFLENEHLYHDEDNHVDCLDEDCEDNHDDHDNHEDDQRNCLEDHSHNSYNNHDHHDHHEEEEEESIYGDHDDDDENDCHKIDCHRRHHEMHHTCELCDHLCVHDRVNYLDGLSSISTLESCVSTITSPPSTLCEEERCQHFTASSIQLALKYSISDWLLTGEVLQAVCPINHRKKTQPVYWQVHIALLPFKKQRVKTQYKATSTPIFNEEFQLVNIAKKALCQYSVRFRIYGRYSRYRRKHLAGECEVHLGILEKKQGFELREWRTLSRDGVCGDDQSVRSNRSHQSFMSEQSIKSEECERSERRDSRSSSSSDSSSGKSTDTECDKKPKKLCKLCDDVLM